MPKMRLDRALVARKLVETRSQAESYIKLGQVKVADKVVTKPGFLISGDQKIELTTSEQYASRAGLKLSSVADKLDLNFKDKIVLDVGSSTGGFTDFALRHGAKKVIAVDVGTDQMHPSLRTDARLELHEKTDIREFINKGPKPDIAVIDVSFISLREVLPAVAKLSEEGTKIVAMFKPQFEAGATETNKGVIKNDRIRRQILSIFEVWAKQKFVITAKADSGVTGAKGNRERFYILKKQM